MCLTVSGISSAQVTPLSDSIAKTSEPYQASFESAITAYEAGNFANALNIAETHARAGNAEAQVMAGHIHLGGEAGLIDTDQALSWFKRAALLADADAYIAIGEMALRSQASLSPKDALEWFSKASNSGRADAKRAIGEMYMLGQGLMPDREKGLDWLQQAVDLGDVIALRKLADAYFDRDAPRALELYERAASHGDTDSAYIAAIMYAENLDVRPNSARLADLLKQAAEAGHPAAQADYGLLVYQGAGVERSAEQAAGWFEKSAIGGDPEGQFLYAFTLAKGDGIEKSFEDAYYWILRSTESGVDDYDKDKKVLRERLEKNVDPAILDAARNRLEN